MGGGFSISEVAEVTGLTQYTLRYYEKEGLLPNVHKTASGMRLYSKDDLNWLSMIECLKATGLSLKGIKQYIDWYKEGDSTLEKRLDMFQTQKKELTRKMKELMEHLEKINFKIKLYENAVQQGSLEKAENLPEMKRMKKKVFVPLIAE